MSRDPLRSSLVLPAGIFATREALTSGEYMPWQLHKDNVALSRLRQEGHVTRLIRVERARLREDPRIDTHTELAARRRYVSRLADDFINDRPLGDDPVAVARDWELKEAVLREVAARLRVVMADDFLVAAALRARPNTETGSGT